jgi:hypothetical protein
MVGATLSFESLNKYPRHPRCVSQNHKIKQQTLESQNTTILYIQGVSRLEDITAGGDFLGLCQRKSLYKHVSDFGRLRSYDLLKLRMEGNDY